MYGQCCSHLREYAEFESTPCSPALGGITINRNDNCNALGWDLQVTSWGDEGQGGNDECRSIRYAFYLQGNYIFHVEGKPQEIVVANDIGFGQQTGNPIVTGENSTYMSVSYDNYDRFLEFLSENTNISFTDLESEITMRAFITNCCGEELTLEEYNLTSCEENITTCDGEILTGCDGEELTLC